MATQGQNNVKINIRGVVPFPQELVNAGYTFHRARGAADWFLFARSRSNGLITRIYDQVIDFQYSEDLTEIMQSGSAKLWNAPDQRGRYLSQFIDKGTELRMYVRNPVTMRLDEKERFVVWERSRHIDGTMDITFYDMLKYLHASETTVLYTNKTAAEATMDMCKAQGIPIARLPKCKYKIPYFYQQNTNMLDILVRMWTLESKKSGRKFIIRMWKGSLYIFMKPTAPRASVMEIVNKFNSSGIATGLSHNESLEGVITSIRLWGTKRDFGETGTPDARKAVAMSRPFTNPKGIAQWGRIHYEEPIDGVTTQGELDTKAKEMLSDKGKLKRDVSFSLTGFPYIRASAPVRIIEYQVGLTGTMWVKSLEHRISAGGEYTTSGTLEFFDYTHELETDPSDLKPDQIKANGVPEGGVGVGKAPGSPPAGMPADVYNTLFAAAPAAGVPTAWASSAALAKLLQKESSFGWHAQNPGSTAFGLFQFLDCVPMDSECLTREGWKSYDEVAVGDETLGLNPDTGKLEWTRILSKVKKRQDVVSMKVGNWEARATKGHRWWSERRTHEPVLHRVQCSRFGATGTKRGPFKSTRAVQVHEAKVHGSPAGEYPYIRTGEFVTTDSITKAHRLVVSAPAHTQSTLDITDDEAAILGWVLRDGTISFASRLSSPAARDLMQRAGISGKPDIDFVLAMSPSQRERWLEAVWQAEGWYAESSGEDVKMIAQNRGAAADAIILAAYLQGYRPTVRINKKSDDAPKHWGECLIINLGRPYIGGTCIKRDDLGAQDVWCVETELGTWTMRQNDLPMLTGNSTWAGTGVTKQQAISGSGGKTGNYWMCVAGLRYIKSRYGNPEAAWAYWTRIGWY